MSAGVKLLIAGVVLAMVMLFVYGNKETDIQANSGIQSGLVQPIETELSSTPLMNVKSSAGVTAVSDPSNPIVKIQTSFGDLKIELYRTYAPEVVAEFIELINRNYYVKDTVLESKQGLGFVLAKVGKEMKMFTDTDTKDTSNDLRGIRGSVAILKHTVSPAYLNNIFIGYQSNPDLRDNYIVFGQVLEGIDDIESKASQQGQVTAIYVGNREEASSW